MDSLITSLPNILQGFQQTLLLLLVSGLIALALGTVLAALRVSPVPALRVFGTAYVTLFRNTPLVFVFVLFVVGLPFVGVHVSFFVRAAVALSLYTAAFICEAMRSGINAVHTGQAEAARAIGMTFGQSISLVVLPQAIRNVVPPLASILIALTKNTAVAEVFGVTEATYQLDRLARVHAADMWWLFCGIALGYVVIVLVLSGCANLLERRWAVSR